ncbi:MAG TPA: class F sortase [Mycobacteriales bacterium]
MSRRRSPRRGRRGIVAAAVALALVVVGGILIAVAAAAQKSPPQPSASAAHPAPTVTSGPTRTVPARPGRTARSADTAGKRPTSSAQVPATRGPILRRSAPVSLSIPAIAAHSALLELGQNSDRTVQVPPLGRDSRAGWYRYSPTPGQLGPAVILGHIDSAKYGPGIFFKLGALQPGETVTVTRADRTAAVFRIDRVAEYPKNHFPTLQVYGNIDHAGLRLITCGGSFDFSTHSYDDNIVVYASLISTHPAG